MIKAKKLEEAFEVLQRTPGSSSDPPRVWSCEYPPFDGDKGIKVIGVRYYLVGSIASMWKHFRTIRTPEERNFYEVIYDTCHFYADYDLKYPSTTSVAAAHQAFSTALRNLLDTSVVATITEHVLVGHVPGKKESMHIRWEFRSPSGALVMLANPEEGRKLASAAILATITRTPEGELDFLSSPIFHADHATGKPVSVLDHSVYNKNRNWRLAGNVKPKDPGGHAGWMVPVEQNARGGGEDRVMVTKEVFYENLVCYIPPEETLPVEILDLSHLPDELEAIRDEILGKNKSGLKRTIEIKDHHRVSDKIRVIDKSKPAKSQRQTMERLQGIIENILAAKAGEDVWLVSVDHGAFTMRIDGEFCPIQGSNHTEAQNGYFITRPGYPMPRAYRKCWKDKCIECLLLNPSTAEELEPNEHYATEFVNVLKNTPASVGNPFLYFE